MPTQWNDLIDRFRDRLQAMEKRTPNGSVTWRVWCLEQALEHLEEDPATASKHLDEFDRPATAEEAAAMTSKKGDASRLEDIRRRFDNLGGGIV